MITARTFDQSRNMSDRGNLVLPLSALRRSDVARVGGKNASLGEMIGTLKEAGINVPGGFATTAAAYWRFIEANNLQQRIAQAIATLDKNLGNLADVGGSIRALVLEAPFPLELKDAIRQSYRDMSVDGASSVGWRPISMSKARKRCSTPARSVSLPYSPTVPSPIARPTASIT
jgi:pyruvate,water dikinase